MSLLHLLILLIGTGVDAIIDYKLIKQKKNVHAVAQYVVREMFFIVLAGLFSRGDNQYALYTWVLSHFVYWFFFDNFINILRNKPLIYLSERGIDKIQRPLWAAYILKAVFAVAASLYFFNPGLYSY